MKDRDKVIKDLLASGDRVQHMTFGGGAENGGSEISYQKVADHEDGNGWHLTKDENGNTVRTRVKWSFSGTIVGKAEDDDE